MRIWLAPSTRAIAPLAEPLLTRVKPDTILPTSNFAALWLAVGVTFTCVCEVDTTVA